MQYAARLFVHARPEDACEVSDVKGQGWLGTEFWLRRSSSLDVGLKKINMFIANAAASWSLTSQRAEHSDFW